MIKFDFDKVRVEYHRLLSCTSALSGSAMVVKESKRKKETYKKISLSKEVVRQFIKRNQASKFIKPIPVAIAYYKNIAIAMESHPLGMAGEIFNTEITEGLGKRWISITESNINRFLKPLTRTGTWYIDGKYVYSVTDKDIKDATPLSSDNKFRLISVDSIKLMLLSSNDGLFVDDRKCIGYFLSEKKYSISPPVWRTFDITKNEETDEGDMLFDFVDDYYRVNLHFAMRAGKAVSSLYSYDAIEPLNLGDIILKLKTVNLPALDNAVKATYPIKMSFTHAIAWLLGLLYRKNNLDITIEIRGLLKCLATNGVFHKSMLNETSIFKAGHSTESVPLKTLEDAKTIDDKNIGVILAQVTARRNKNDGALNRVGNLYSSE